ncbi:hypothetical protein GPJ56_000712 [Histomonas meleagridis]|uniref:uncharacterized protein n=1 Tax=Histomonas meleagridis TaxID=135588 RepID=UPI00355A3568|nr:hypothetical protein GPJ56_000712 [Histomonas meleagridis]KAH0804529.1 hypothetical protein GO595_003359 [Histomonas meleagridis]
MSKFPLSKYLDEIYGHQIAAKELMGVGTFDSESSIEDLMKMLSYLFPYDIIFPLFSNDSSFITSILKIAIQYNPANHKQSVFQIHNLLKPQKLEKNASIAISEMILSFFTFNTMRKSFSNPLADFQFTENCRLLVNDKLTSLKIKEEFLTRISKNKNSDAKFNFNFKDLPNSSSLPPLFDDDDSFIIPAIRHVILELRKLTTQPTVTLMTNVLLNAVEYLNSVLSVDNSPIGADESFQFFVAALSEARIYILPSIIFILENYSINSLKTSKTNFLVTQLGISYEFIQTRPLRVPPYLLFPFKSSEIEDIILESEEEIELPGFEVYAFPSFLSNPFPALIYYTGDMTKSAPVYRFRSVQSFTKKTLSTVVQNFQAIPTIRGTLMHIQAEEMKEKEMILIDISKFVDLIEDVNLFSNLILMTYNRFRKFRISMLPEMLRNFEELWRVNPLIDTKCFLYEKVLVIQKVLLDKGILPKTHPTSGVIDKETVAAIKRTVGGFKGNDFYIDPRIYSYLCKLREKKSKN